MRDRKSFEAMDFRKAQCVTIWNPEADSLKNEVLELQRQAIKARSPEKEELFRLYSCVAKLLRPAFAIPQVFKNKMELASGACA